MQEIWKDIKSYEGLYQVSNLGRVKSLSRQGTKGNILVPKKNADYLKVSLYKECKSKNVLIHRLVAEAFIPNPNNYKEINHIDENKQNNSLDNLEWCDRRYNMNYGTIKQRLREAWLQNQNII